MLCRSPIPFQPYTLDENTNRYRTDLPHWRHPGVTYFVTFRLADSIPKEVLAQWELEKIEWLKEQGVEVNLPVTPENIPVEFRYRFDRKFNRKLNAYLDGCHGSCVLRESKVRAPLLARFEDVDCLIGDYVIMPNHVHVLMTPVKGESLEDALRKVKGASARGMNQVLNRSGKVWKKHSFDHIVRNEEQLENYQEYIVSNPKGAGLSEGEYDWGDATYLSV